MEPTPEREPPSPEQHPGQAPLAPQQHRGQEARTPQQQGGQVPVGDAPAGPAPGSQDLAAYQWVPQQPLPPLPTVPSALPVEPREYHRFFRAPRWRWWRGLLILAMAGALFLIASVVLTGVALVIDIARGVSTVQDLQQGKLTVTPLIFLSNNVALALLLPVSMGTAWAVTGQRPRWLSSVIGRFRWRWAATVAAVVVPIYLVYLGVGALSGAYANLRWNNNSLLLIVGILLTTPFQAAGEEYGFRGLVNRTVGSWFSHTTVGLLLGLVVSSLIFMLAHAASDPWLNVFYFLFGAIACLLTWRTGGLEAAVVMHVTNNLMFEITLPFSDISGLFDRSVGTGDPTMLVITGMQVLILVLVEVLARRAKLVRRNAPGLLPEQAADRAAPAQLDLPFGPGTAPYPHDHHGPLT